MNESRFERNVGAALFSALLIAGIAILLHVYIPWEEASMHEQMSLPMLLLWGVAALGLSMLLYTLFRSQHYQDHDIRIADDDILRRFEEADRATAAAKKRDQVIPPEL